MKNFLIIAAVLLLVSCGGTDTPSEQAPKEAPLEQSTNSERFNETFGKMMESYYSLKDALVATNDTAAGSAALGLATDAQQLAFDEIKADSAIVFTAKDYANSIATDAAALASAKGVEEKRKIFQPLSENLYTLLKTVRYDKEVVYQQFCPMAFDDAGAAWLSKSSDIKNPYFGKKMLTCGEVQDSIDFRAH